MEDIMTINYIIKGFLTKVNGSYDVRLVLSKNNSDDDSEDISTVIYDKVTSFRKNKLSKSDIDKTNLDDFIKSMGIDLVKPVDIMKDINTLYANMRAVAKKLDTESQVIISTKINIENTYNSILNIGMRVKYSSDKLYDDIDVEDIIVKLNDNCVISNTDKHTSIADRIKSIIKTLDDSFGIRLTSSDKDIINEAVEVVTSDNFQNDNYIHLGYQTNAISADIVYNIKLFVNIKEED